VPRYIVERTFSEIQLGLATASESVVRRNAELGVTWIHSFVNTEQRVTFCLYEAATPDAIRAAALANGLPVDRIIEVSVLDPHRYG
jgi:hypothetical protein